MEIVYGALLLQSLLILRFIRQLKNPARLITLQGRDQIWRFVVANGFLQGNVGLLNHQALSPFTGIILATTRRIHTVGMHFAIDAVGIDSRGRITDVKPSLSAGLNRVVFSRQTVAIIELPAGAVESLLADWDNAVFRNLR